MANKEKTRYLLGWAFGYTLVMPLFTILIEVLFGVNMREAINHKIMDVRYLILSLLFYFIMGLVVGLVVWNQKKRQKQML